MKLASHLKYLILFLALGIAGRLAIAAEAGEPDPEAPVASDAPAAPEQPASPSEETTTPEADEPEEELRDLTSSDDEETSAADADESEDSDGRHRRRHSHRSGNERISFGSGSTLGEGEYAKAVISIVGSSTSAGEVGDAVVSILGNSRVTGGAVGGDVVSVVGNTYVNTHVRGEVVAVLGSVELGPDAVVDGEIVCIGGQVTRADGATVRGNIQNIGIAGRHFDFTGVTTWITECLLYGRPLAFNRHLLWAWGIALAALGLYSLIALIAPAGVVKCAETLEQRPGYSLLAALLTLLLTPVAYILLTLTIAIAIGVVLIPLFSLGLFFASIFGKIVMLAWLGRRITRLFGDSPLAHPVFGVLLGGMIVLGLYTIPIVGFITYKLIGMLGLGVVVYTLILQVKASRPPRPVAAAVIPPPSATGAAGLGTTAAMPVSGPSGDPVPPVTAMLAPAPVVISAATLPRAGFWLRVGAAVLDLILVAITMGLLESVFMIFNLHPGGAYPFWVALYCVVMWATKGTTIGGIICGLKLVRLDDRPVDWGVAIVRGLSAFLSLAVVGLGFIWVAFDDERQSWHDKIAGTTLVKVPKGTALL